MTKKAPPTSYFWHHWLFLYKKIGTSLTFRPENGIFYMNKWFIVTILVAALAGSCGIFKSQTPPSDNPITQILAKPSLQQVLKKKDIYGVQIIYTQIDRDEKQVPHFTSWSWNVDSARYFYPASMVKMPLALLALEKINTIKASGFPRMSSAAYYMLDSLRPNQHVYKKDTAAPNGKPSIAQDVRAIFATSDNQAYNHLFDFLGRTYINESLAQRGFNQTGIVHRFYAADRDQAYAQPITFYDDTRGLFKEGEKIDKKKWRNPQKGLLKGEGYVTGADSLVKKPFDFATKNWFALTDMEMVLRAALFPQVMPEEKQFKIAPDDLKMLHRSMGLFPREFDYPKYNPTAFWDGYVKFFIFGDTKDQQSGDIRSFNKVGEAYGTLTDVAYIVDFKTNTEFILAATILCNTDGIFNDDKYDYDNTGFPFLAELGRSALEYDRKRPRKVKPDLSYWKERIE
jgi:hypothetical protein